MGLFSRKDKIKRWKPQSLDILLEKIASGTKDFENIDVSWKKFRLDLLKESREDNRNTVTYSKMKDFSHCNFTNSKFNHCLIMTADFSHCNFTNSEMKQAEHQPKDFNLDEEMAMKLSKPYPLKFNNSNFTGSDLSLSIFTKADFTNANFTNANLIGTKFYFCNMTNTTFKDTTIRNLELLHCDGVTPDFTNAKNDRYFIDGIKYND
jgi:uncharacterized protein YjbI with pentapeptide repeats